jgi:ABC-type transport system involved in cytochrome c biogenesis permease subunit
MSAFHRVVPWAVAALALVFVASRLRPAASPDAFDFASFGRLSVSSEGRTKPLDTFARSSLMILSGRQTMETEGGSAPAIRWYAEMVAKPEDAMKRRVFRIDHPDVLAVLGLPRHERTRFSFEELAPKFEEIARQSKLAKDVRPKQRDPFQRAVLGLEDRLMLYLSIGRLESPYGVAPLASGEEWRPVAVLLGHDGTAAHASVESYRTILGAYVAQDAPAFNRAVAEYAGVLDAKLPAAQARSAYEVVFSRVEPFYLASVLYVGALLAASLALLAGTLSRGAWGGTLGRSAAWLIGVAFLVHTLGIVSRVYLQGRPPVTNLYSSAVFIGWAAVPVAMIVRRAIGLALGSIVASVIGFATLVVAHNLSTTGDTMEVMQAVLDSNFWLATHVVVVTIGYSATFLAGFLALAYILLGVPTGLLRGELSKSLPKAIYGVVCFATVTSFLGTVLGGIWADQSWGRFWGWDPKENGAALIVLMNLIILHARWGGMVQARGIAVLAVLGNIVTAWSWFGTNMLGVGLHSYGFMESAVFWIAVFMLSQLAGAAVGLTPTRWWRSLREG